MQYFKQKTKYDIFTFTKFFYLKQSMINKTEENSI